MAFLLVSERVLLAYLADMVELNHRKVGIRCLVKAENNKESLSKTTWSVVLSFKHQRFR